MISTNKIYTQADIISFSKKLTKQTGLVFKEDFYLAPFWSSLDAKATSLKIHIRFTTGRLSNVNYQSGINCYHWGFSDAKHISSCNLFSFIKKLKKASLKSL